MITLVNPTLPYGFAKRHGVILLELGDIAVVGLREGADPSALVETRRALGRPLRVEPLGQAAFDRQLSEVYAGDHLNAADGDDLDMPSGLESLIDDIPAAADLLDTADDAPVIRLINGIIAEAVRSGASDIHLEPFETALTVRMRVDGVLRETLSLNPRITPLLVSRIKVMARLDIAEKRVPQDGRIPLTLGGKTLDVRVSTLPSRAGERVVLRILDKDQAGLTLDRLGMSTEALEAFRGALKEPNGIILVTGPTGSGKTTSLYAGLSLLNDATRNILTVEDPVEYAMDGIGQTQVNPKVGMTFAAGLRAILRQDPDVVMVGEIRDVETARGRCDHPPARHGGRALSASLDPAADRGAAAGAAAVWRMPTARDGGRRHSPASGGRARRAGLAAAGLRPLPEYRLCRPGRSVRGYPRG